MFMFFGLPHRIAIFYIVALGLALLKDLLDLVLIGSLPGIGSIITFIFSLAIVFLILLAGLLSVVTRGVEIKSMTRIWGVIKRLLVLTGGTGVEELFGLNLLPWETGTVILIMWMHGREYKKAKKRKVKDYVYVT